MPSCRCKGRFGSYFEVMAFLPLQMSCMWFHNQPDLVKLKKEKLLKVSNVPNKLLMVELIVLSSTTNMDKTKVC